VARLFNLSGLVFCVSADLFGELEVYRNILQLYVPWICVETLKTNTEKLEHILFQPGTVGKQV